ncbi:hypothetical protein KA977_09475 [Candidatus Dependentiae bacterium]|nr:hypothetical protein [Candidatus Dependentiae bacterium]
MNEKYFIKRNGEISGPFTIEIIWLYRNEYIEISSNCKNWIQLSDCRDFFSEITIKKHNNAVLNQALEYKGNIDKCSDCGKLVPSLFSIKKYKKIFCPHCDFIQFQKNNISFNRKNAVKKIIMVSLFFDLILLICYILFFPVNNKIDIIDFKNSLFYSPSNTYFFKFTDKYFSSSKRFEELLESSELYTNSEIYCGDTGYIILNISGNIVKCYRNTLIKIETYGMNNFSGFIGLFPGIDSNIKKIRLNLITGRLSVKTRNSAIKEIAVKNMIFKLNKSKSEIMFIRDLLDGYYYTEDNPVEFYKNQKDYPLKIIIAKGSIDYKENDMDTGFYNIDGGIFKKENTNITKYLFEKIIRIIRKTAEDQRKNFSLTSKYIENYNIILPYFLDNRELFEFLNDIEVYPTYKIAAYKILIETAISGNIIKKAKSELIKIENEYSEDKNKMKSKIISDNFKSTD